MERQRLPSDTRMEMVSGALLQASKSINDDFYFYHKYITEVDMTLEQLSESTGGILIIISQAIDAYLPEQYSDHRLLDVIKTTLEKALPNYKAIRNYNIQDS